jgi:hypothetical protein
MYLGQVGIRHGGERAVQRADAGGTRAYRLHRTAAVAILDEIADPKWPVREDRDAALCNARSGPLNVWRPAGGSFTHTSVQGPAAAVGSAHLRPAS